MLRGRVPSPRQGTDRLDGGLWLVLSWGALWGPLRPLVHTTLTMAGVHGGLRPAIWST